MTNVEIVQKTKDGANIKKIEIEKMNITRTLQVSKDVAHIVKFINSSDKLQNVFKTFNEKNQEVAKEYEEEYARQKKAKVKEEDMELPDVPVQAMTRTGIETWNDILSVISNLLEEIPETVLNLIANASGIDKKVLGEQEIETFMDVLDATVEVNDLEVLVNRIKKSKGTFSQITKVFKKQQ